MCVGSRRESPRRWLALLVIASTLFFAMWVTRSVPPTAGGEAVLLTVGRGYLPYRDYFSQAPPGVPMLLQAVGWTAGPHLLAVWTFGAVLRIAGVCALFGLLLEVARPSYSALG